MCAMSPPAHNNIILGIATVVCFDVFFSHGRPRHKKSLSRVPYIFEFCFFHT